MPDVSYRVPTFQRFKEIFKHRKTQSILRCLEYERMQLLNLKGRVLDFGGGSETNYKAHVHSWGDGAAFVYESANIDPNTQPTYLIAEQGEIPAAENSFDAVISLNTLEHVYRLDFVLDEISRVLKPGGTLTFIVPFIFRVHGHPNDFHRGTPAFWERMLAARSYGDIKVEALTWGPFSTATTVSGLPGPLKRQRQFLALVLDLLWSRSRHAGKTVIEGNQDGSHYNAPLAYFIEARLQSGERPLDLS